MTESQYVLVGAGAVFLLAGAVKGVVGMGLPTVAMGLLGLMMAPVQAAALLVIPSLVTNVWQLLAGPSLRRLVRRFATLMLATVAGTFITADVLTKTDGNAASIALGCVLAVYGLLGLSGLRLSVAPHREKWLSPVVGFTTGAITGATGVFVIPSVPYFGSLGLDKEELIQTLGLSFTVSTLALGGALLWAGQFPSSLAGGSLLALAPALLGMFLGQAIRARLRPETFRRWFFSGLLLLGLYMVARAYSI